MLSREFLRKLSDIVAAADVPETKGSTVINIGTININPDTPKSEEDTPMDRDDVMIPPLQAKIEIMKKMAGISPKNQELLATDDEEPMEQ